MSTLHLHTRKIQLTGLPSFYFWMTSITIIQTGEDGQTFPSLQWGIFSNLKPEHLGSCTLREGYHNRTTFMHFIEYPNTLLDNKNIWYFLKRLSKTWGDRLLWNELNKKLKFKVIIVMNFSTNGTTFISSYPCHDEFDCSRAAGFSSRSRDGFFLGITI